MSKFIDNKVIHLKQRAFVSLSLCVRAGISPMEYSTDDSSLNFSFSPIDKWLERYKIIRQAEDKMLNRFAYLHSQNARRNDIPFLVWISRSNWELRFFFCHDLRCIRAECVHTASYYDSQNSHQNHTETSLHLCVVYVLYQFIFILAANIVDVQARSNELMKIRWNEIIRW